MNIGIIQTVFLAWPLIVAALTRAIGPRKAVLIGLIGGHLFLPVAEVTLGLPGVDVALNRWIVIALSLILGPLIFDRRTVLATRPSWLDLPMAAYYLAPLIGLATGDAGSLPDTLDMMTSRGLVWLVPYAMGRIYFGRRDGPATVAIALTIGGLSYIPVCLYEEIAGPDKYLGFLIYGIKYGAGMVNRMGGWRPEGFLNDGIAVASWMAMTTVMATWLWLGGWRPRRCPAWAPALALLLATLSCRGVYGYMIMAIGLASVMLTRLLRTRAVLVVLMVVPLLYVGFRSTGAWDGKELVKAATFSGKEGTVDWRVKAEDEVVARVVAYNPFFGLGRSVGQIGVSRAVDGRWLIIICSGGFVGLTLQMLTFHLLPAGLALSKPHRRPDARQAASPSWGLACWCIIQLIDSLHNVSYFTPTALVAGTLVGFFSCNESDTFRAKPAVGGRNADRRPIPIPLIVSVILLIAIEFLGRLPRMSAPPLSSPALEDPPPKNQP